MKIEIDKITEEDINKALLEIKERAMEKIRDSRHAKYPFVTLSEAAGKLTEEYNEAMEEAHEKNLSGFLSEIKDLGYVCVRALVQGKVKKEDF